jgi:hypothetical protein
MANISLKRLFEAEDFKARSKQTGKLVHFKSKDAYQAALKAGSHEDPKDKKDGPSKATKPNDMFGGDYSKDRGGEPKIDGMATVKSIAAKTGLRATAVAGWADENGVNLSNLSADIDSKKLKPMDLMTAISGNPGNKYAKDIIAKYSQGGGSKSEPQTEPTSKPKEARKGNPSVNKEAKKNAESFGITPQKLGNDGYKKVMLQAAVEALTDANFHDEARELISKIEGKPEWAKRVDYPSMDDPKYKEKMADIRTNGVDSSEYWRGDDNAHEFGRKVSSASGWDGVDAADGIAFTLRMNGFHKQADMIQSVFDNKPYMRENTIIKKTNENKMKNISLKVLLEAEDFQARSKETGKLVHFKSKDAYQAAIKAGSHEDPKAGNADASKGATKPNDMFSGDYAKDRGDDGFGWGPETDRKPASSLPKKASQLDFKHTKVIEDVLKAETGFDGYTNVDDNTGAFMINGKNTGDTPTYTLYFGANDDYGKPDEFRVSLESTYGNDPSSLQGKIDKSFKSADEAMKFMIAVAKKHKKELEMDDEDTNESTKLTSMIKK